MAHGRRRPTTCRRSTSRATPSSRTPSTSTWSTPSSTTSTGSSTTSASCPADNAFEGTRTVRIYNLLAHGPHFEQIPVHPAILPICEGVLDRGLLVSSLSSIAIGPGETAQPIHADDQVIPLPKPHPATVCNTMWALTDFTEANGATRLVPGSHRADHSPDLRRTYDTVPAEMAKGSVLVWHGSLWHGGGANTTDERRVGIAMNYCAGYIRQQENQQLGLPPDTVGAFPRRLQELVGYGIYRGLIGHIDKQVPANVAPGRRRRPPAAVGRRRPGRRDGRTGRRHRSARRPEVLGLAAPRLGHAPEQGGGQRHRQERDHRGPAEPVADVGHGPEDHQADRGTEHPGHQEPARHRGPDPGREQLVDQRADGRGEHRAGQDPEDVADHQRVGPPL